MKVLCPKCEQADVQFACHVETITGGDYETEYEVSCDVVSQGCRCQFTERELDDLAIHASEVFDEKGDDMTNTSDPTRLAALAAQLALLGFRRGNVVRSDFTECFVLHVEDEGYEATQVLDVSAKNGRLLGRVDLIEHDEGGENNYRIRVNLSPVMLAAMAHVHAWQQAVEPAVTDDELETAVTAYGLMQFTRGGVEASDGSTEEELLTAWDDADAAEARLNAVLVRLLDAKLDETGKE